MALQSLADVPDGAHVLIDANIFVYHFSAPPAFSDAPSSQFLKRVETGLADVQRSHDIKHRYGLLTNDAILAATMGRLGINLTVYGLPEG